MKKKKIILVAILATVVVGSLIGLGIWRFGKKPVVTQNTAPCADPPSKTPKPLPDIYIITVDTLRADYLGIYGDSKVQTPHIDSLGKKGMIFTEATTPFPRTTPALASMLTGLRPKNHGSREVFDDMKNGTTVAELLCKEGYATRAVSANAAASHLQNLDRGFETFILDKGAQAHSINDLALELVAQAPKDRPLFLWVHYLDPHFIYKPPMGWRPDIDDDSCLTLMWKISLGMLERREVFVNHNEVAEEALASCREYYRSEITYADHHVGLLLNALKTLRANKNPLTIFSSDHGENLGEHQLYYEHGPSPHDASSKIPLIIVGDGIKKGTDKEIARLEDLMPTILDVLNVPQNKRPIMDGVSLESRLFSPHLNAESAQADVAYIHGGRALHAPMSLYPISGRDTRTLCVNGPRYSTCWDPQKEPKLYDRVNDPDRSEDLAAKKPDLVKKMMKQGKKWSWDNAFPIAIRTPSFKLAAYPDLEKGERCYALYDLRKDPKEETDVSKKHPEETERLKTLLDNWFSNAPRSKQKNLSQEELEQMRALGYIE